MIFIFDWLSSSVFVCLCKCCGCLSKRGECVWVCASRQCVRERDRERNRNWNNIVVVVATMIHQIGTELHEWCVCIVCVGETNKHKTTSKTTTSKTEVQKISNNRNMFYWRPKKFFVCAHGENIRRHLRRQQIKKLIQTQRINWFIYIYVWIYFLQQQQSSISLYHIDCSMRVLRSSRYRPQSYVRNKAPNIIESLSRPEEIEPPHEWMCVRSCSCVCVCVLFG